MLTASIVIRPAEERDVAALAALNEQLGYPASEEAMARRLRELASTPEHAVLVADAGGRCAGWIHVAFVRSLESDVFAEIRGLIVDEPLRGSGIGSALVSAAEGWAAARGCARIRVRSNTKRERTHRFYASRGYALAKEQKVFDKLLSS